MLKFIGKLEGLNVLPDNKGYFIKCCFCRKKFKNLYKAQCNCILSRAERKCYELLDKICLLEYKKDILLEDTKDKYHQIMASFWLGVAKLHSILKREYGRIGYISPTNYGYGRYEDHWFYRYRN